MFKIIVLILCLLIPCTALCERIYGQTTYPRDGGSYTTLRSSDGSSATITTYPQGGISIYTTPSTDQMVDELNRTGDEARRAVEQLNNDHD